MKNLLPDTHFETRAALDIGSGQTKITIADVNTASNKIVCIHQQSVKFVFLRKDLAMSPEGVLSKTIQSHLIETLNEMQQASVIHNPTKWIAAGTSVFRQAQNSQTFIEETEKATGIKIKVISQAEEAEIGFHSALGVSCEEKDNIISLDVGSGSFQISCWINGKLHMYGSEIGSQAVFDALFEIRKQAFSIEHNIHPLSYGEVLGIVERVKSRLHRPPEWLVMNVRKIIAIGNGNIFPTSWMNQDLILTPEKLLQAVFYVVGMDKNGIREFNDPNSVIILLIYYALMEHCGIEKIHYHVTNGGCEGLLTQEHYWMKMRP
jgi:hypothetical protein